MSHPRTQGRPVLTGSVPGPIPGGSQPIQPRDPIPGALPARDGARDAQDLSRTEGSLGSTTEATPRQRLSTQLTEFNRLRQSENPQDQERARRMLGQVLTAVRDLQQHLSTQPRELARDYLTIRIASRMATDFLNTHRSPAGSAAFRREGAQLVDFQQAREQAEGSLRTLRQQVLLPTLPAAGTVPTLDQLRNARLAAAISRDLGDRETAFTDCQRFRDLVNHLPGTSLQGPAGQEFLDETLRFAARCQAEDRVLGNMAFGASARIAASMPASQRDLAAYQFIAATGSISEDRVVRFRNYFTRYLERRLNSEGVSAEVRSQRALEQGQALLQLRAQGVDIETPAGLLSALRNGGGILARYAEALNPESRENPAEVLASLATRTPRTLTELMAVRFGAEVRAQAGADPSGDPLQRALAGFDASAYSRVGRLEYYLGEARELASREGVLTGADLRRARAALNSIREVRAEIDGHLSEDPQLQAFQLQGLLQADQVALAMRHRLGDIYGTAPREMLGETDQAYAEGNRELERNIQSSTQALTRLRQTTLATAQDTNAGLASRIQSYRLANQIDIALGSGNERAQDLSAWQTLMGQATDSDVSTADRFTDLGTILSGFQQLRQRRYDEGSLALIDTDWQWGDLVPGNRSERLSQARAAGADPSRIQMSDADLTTHMTQARDSIFALLPIVNPPTDPLAQATNSQYQAELNLLVSSRPGNSGALSDAARILPMLSADGFVNFQSEPSVELALLGQLTTQANQHLTEGHVTIDTLRGAGSTVSMEDGQSRPLSDFISGVENNQLTFTDAYRGLSVDDQRRVIQETLHLGRLGEYRAALANETDPVRRHFRSAMLELEQGNTLRGQAELQTFLRDVRQPGEDQVLRPIADPQLAAMRTVALDMNRRLMGQALDRLAQVSGELDAQRSENFAGFMDRDFGGNESTIQALRNLINDPANGFYSLDEALPVVRHQRIAAGQADFGRTIRADAPILLPCGPNVVGLHNMGNLTLPEMSAMQQRQQALEAAAYRGMAVSGTGGETRFGAEGLIPERNSHALFTAFSEHPEQALDGVPTVRMTPRGTITFAPHRGAPRGQTSILRVEIPPEGGFVMVESFRTGELQRTHFPPASGPRFVLLYQHHHLEGSSRRSGVIRPGEGAPPGSRTEFDPILNRVFQFESFASIQQRSQSPDANRQASLALADQLRTRGGSYTAAARIYEEVMGDAIHQAQLGIPQSELRRLTREAEAARPEVTSEIHRRVFQMVERGMPRPTQTQIDGMIEQALQQRVQTQVRMLTFQRVRDRRDSLDPLARQAWDSYNDMMDPLDEWLNFSDSSMDRIIDEVVVNLAFTIASGGMASVAAGATRAVATRLAARWLASEGTTLIGERAALWAAGRGASSVAGRAILWTMGETATQSGRHIAARALIWGTGVVVEGAVFHASMTGMQSTWGFVRNGEWVFPPPGEFAEGAGHSILMMGSIGVGNAVWGRIGTELGVMPQQVARMTEASRAARMARLTVHHTGQLATEVTMMTATTARPEGQSFATAATHNLVTILELRAGGHIFHGLTGGRLQRYQRQIENEITQTRVRSIVQERFGLDPNSAEGRLMAGAIHHSMAEGQSIDAVSGMATRERLETLRRSIRQELNVDPNSEQGQILTSLLLRHTMGRAGGPQGMGAAMLDVPGRLGELNRTIRGITERGGARGEQADQISQSLLAQALSRGHTAESLQSLNASLTLLIEGGGFGTGEEAAQLRVTLLNHALATGQTHEQIADLASHADGLRARIHDLTNQLYGDGAAATPFGRSVSARLLTWALSQSGRPEDLPRRLEALDDAMPQITETIEGCNRELGLSNSSLEGLQNFNHVLTWAMSGSHSAAEIQQRLEATRRELPAMRASIGQITRSLGYAEGTEGASRIAAALLLRLRGEAGSESAFNHTELAAYLNSVGDFGRQIDLILATDAGVSLRPHRSRIIALAIQNSMTPEALHRLGQELHTGRRRLEITADGELHTVEDPTVAPVGEITLPPVAEPVVATVPASGNGTQPLNQAARSTGNLARPVVVEARPEREVFFGDQVREGREITESAGLAGNQEFLRGLAQLIVATGRGGEQGFANSRERNQFLTGQLRQAQELAQAAGQGENRELIRRLGELVRDTFRGGERGFEPAPDSPLVVNPAEPAHPVTIVESPALPQTFRTGPDAPIYSVRTERVFSPDATQNGAPGVVFANVAELGQLMNGPIPSEVRGMILATTRINRERGIPTVNPRFTLSPSGHRLTLEFGPAEARQAFSVSGSPVELPALRPRSAVPEPVAAGSLPSTFSPPGHEYRVESRRLEANTALADGEVAFTDARHPPRELSRVEQEVLNHILAFADAHQIGEGRRFILDRNNRVALEFERDGVRQRVTLERPTTGQMLQGTQVGGFRVEGNTLHVDFTPENLMTRRITVGGQTFSIHLGVGDTFQLRNEHQGANGQITVIHAHPEQLNLRQVTYDYRIMPHSEGLRPDQVRGTVQVLSVEPILDTEGQATGEMQIHFQLPNGQAHTRTMLRGEVEQSLQLPLTADGHLDPGRPVPRLVQAEGSSIGYEARPRQETLGSLEDTAIRAGDQITINGETFVFQPELGQAAGATNRRAPSEPPPPQMLPPTNPPPRMRPALAGRVQAPVVEVIPQTEGPVEPPALGTERRAEPLSPPPPNHPLEIQTIPPAPRLPSMAVTNQSHAEIRLVELTFPPGYARPNFMEFTPLAETRDIVSHLEDSGHGELARALRQDLQTVESAAHDSPEFEAAIQRIGSVLRTKFIEAEFSRTPVPFMSDAMFGRFADHVRDAYRAQSDEAPPESGVRRTHRPRRGAEEQPVLGTGTDGPPGERNTVRPGRTPQNQVEVAPVAATAIPPLPESGPVGEAVQRGRRLAAGDSPLAPHARRAMERLERTPQDSPEFRTALNEVETLAEIARDAQLTVPEPGHPQREAIAARRDLAQRAQTALVRSQSLANGESPLAPHVQRAMERLPRNGLNTPDFRTALAEVETLVAIAHDAQLRIPEPGHPERDSIIARQALARDAQTILARGEPGSSAHSLTLKTFRLAAGGSPLARHARPILERLARNEEGTSEFRAALVEANTLTEIANTTQLRLPPRGHVQHTSALAFQSLARGAEVSLGRTEPGSPEFLQGLAAYRRGRDSVARDLVQAHNAAMENVVAFLREVGAGGRAWTEVQQRHPFLEAPRFVAEYPPNGRLKAESDVLAKLNRRDWTSLEPMTDFAGTRAVVESYEDVAPLLAAIQSRYTIRGVHDAEGNLTSARDRDGMRRLIEGARSGYRAIHVVVEIEGRPVEIQVQTRAIYEWGQIQHGLIYAEIRGSSGAQGDVPATYTLTGSARRAADAYCQRVATYLADIEQGATLGERPSTEAVINSLPADIPADARRSVMAQLTRMDELITATQRRFRGEPAAEEAQGGAEIIAFPRRPPIPSETALAQAAEEPPVQPLPSGSTTGPAFISPFPAGTEGASARRTFARALETQLNGTFGDLMEAPEIAAARAYVQAVGRGEEPSAEITSAALEAFGYRTTRTLNDGSHIAGGTIQIPAGEPAANSMFRATVLEVNGGNIRLRWRGQEITLRGLEGDAPFQPNQVVVYIPPVAGASGATFRMTPPSGSERLGEIRPMSGVQEFTVGRRHGQSYDPAISGNHAVFRRGSDGLWRVEDLGSLNGVHVLGADGHSLRIPQGQPVLLQEGSVLLIGNHSYTFRPPLEPGMVIPAAQHREGVVEPAILAPNPGQTRFNLQPGVTVERAGDHWYVVSGQTTVRVNNQSRSGTNPLREGDLVEINGRRFRFQPEVIIQTHGQEVSRISVSQPGHPIVDGFPATVVAGRVGSDGQVELRLTRLRQPISADLVQVASILRLTRAEAEQHGFRFNADGTLAAGSPAAINVYEAPPAPPSRPATEVIDHSSSAPQNAPGGPYRGSNPVERVELSHPVDQAGTAYSIAVNDAVAQMNARMRGQETVVAHPVRTVIVADGTSYVTFEIPGHAGAPVRRFVLRMSTDQARELGMTRGNRPAQDFVIGWRPQGPQPVQVPPPRQAPPQAPVVQPLEVTVSDGRSFQVIPSPRLGLGELAQAQNLNLGEYFGMNPRLISSTSDQIRIEMEVLETRRLTETPRPRGETIRMTLPRARALELGIIRPDGSVAETIGLNRGNPPPPGTVSYGHRGDGEFTFGREAPSGSADLTVAPEMRMISRRQAVFRYRNGELSVQSLAAEGTWFLSNGRWTELTPDTPAISLGEGDLVAFGRPRDIRVDGSGRSAPMAPRERGEQSDLVVLEVRDGRLISGPDNGLRWAQPGPAREAPRPQPVEPVIPRTPRNQGPQPVQQSVLEGNPPEAPTPLLAAVAVPSVQGRGPGSAHSYRIRGPESRDGRQVYRLRLDERGAPAHVPTEIEISGPTALEAQAMEGLLSPRRREAGVEVRATYRDRIPLADLPNGGNQAPLIDFYVVAEAEAMGSVASGNQPSITIADPTARGSSTEPLFVLQRQGEGYRLILQGEGAEVRDRDGRPHPPAAGNPRAFDLRPGDRVRFGMTELTFDGRGFTLPTEISTEARVRVPSGRLDEPPPPGHPQGQGPGGGQPVAPSGSALAVPSTVDPVMLSRIRQVFQQEVLRTVRGRIYRNSPTAPTYNAVPVEFTLDANTGALVPADAQTRPSQTIQISFVADLEQSRLVFERESREGLQRLIDDGTLTGSTRSVVESILQVTREPLFPTVPEGSVEPGVLPAIPIAQVRDMQATLRQGLPNRGAYTLNLSPLRMNLEPAGGLMEGELYFDGAGNIVGSSFGLSDFSTARGTRYEAGLRTPHAVHVTTDGEGNILSMSSHYPERGRMVEIPLDLAGPTAARIPPNINERQLMAATALFRAPESVRARQEISDQNPQYLPTIGNPGATGRVLSLSRLLERRDTRQIAVVRTAQGGHDFAQVSEANSSNTVAIVDVDYVIPDPLARYRLENDPGEAGRLRYHVASGDLPPEMRNALEFVRNQLEPRS